MSRVEQIILRRDVTGVQARHPGATPYYKGDTCSSSLSVVWAVGES